MQNMRKGVQVYTVREFIGTPEGYEQSLRKIREIGYDSVQTYGWKIPDAEHKAFLEELGLTTESVGANYEEMLPRSRKPSTRRISTAPISSPSVRCRSRCAKAARASSNTPRASIRSAPSSRKRAYTCCTTRTRSSSSRLAAAKTASTCSSMRRIPKRSGTASTRTGCSPAARTRPSTS